MTTRPGLSWTTFSYVSRPSNCRICEVRFKEEDHMLQRELLHVSVKYGPLAAEEELNERYAEWHMADHPAEG